MCIPVENGNQIPAMHSVKYALQGKVSARTRVICYVKVCGDMDI